LEVRTVGTLSNYRAFSDSGTQGGKSCQHHWLTRKFIPDADRYISKYDGHLLRDAEN